MLSRIQRPYQAENTRDPIKPTAVDRITAVVIGVLSASIILAVIPPPISMTLSAFVLLTSLLYAIDPNCQWKVGAVVQETSYVRRPRLDLPLFIPPSYYKERPVRFPSKLEIRVHDRIRNPREYSPFPEMVAETKARLHQERNQSNRIRNPREYSPFPETVAETKARLHQERNQST